MRFLMTVAVALMAACGTGAVGERTPVVDVRAVARAPATIVAREASDLVPTRAATGKLLWSVRTGGPEGQVPKGVTIAPDGTTVVVGTFSGGASFGKTRLRGDGRDTPFVLHLDPRGEIRDARGFQGSVGHWITPLFLASGAFVLTGTASYGALDFGAGEVAGNGDDPFAVRFDASLRPVWQRRWVGPHNEKVIGAARHDDGFVIVGEQYEADLDLGTGPLTKAGFADAFVAAIDESGVTRWVHREATADGDDPHAIAVARDGDVVFLVSTSYVQTSDEVLHLVRLDRDGRQRFRRDFPRGQRFAAHPKAIGVWPNGVIVVAGQIMHAIDLGTGVLPHHGLSDAFVAAYDRDGRPLWVRTWGDEGFQWVASLAVDDDGTVVVYGVNRGVIDLGDGPHGDRDTYEGWVAKLDRDGKVLWSHALPNALDGNGGQLVAIDPRSHESVVTAAVTGTADYGTGALPPVDHDSDVVVLRFAP